MTTKEIKSIVPVLEKASSPIINKIAELTVVDEPSKKQASTLLNELTTFQKKVVAYKETKTKPLNQALKVIRDETRELEGNLKTAIDATRSKLGVYQTEQLRLARIEEDKIAARVGVGSGHFTTETAVRKIDELEKPSQSVATGVGEVKFRTVKKLVITNHTEVMHWAVKNNVASVLLQINEQALKAHILEKGAEVEGAHIEEVQEAASYK